jgi:hypothetical protein
MLILDTNQAEQLPKPQRNRQRELCLGELIVAEILLRSEAARNRTFKRLRGYRVRLGVQPAQLLDDLAQLSASEIISYRPFLAASEPLTRALLKRIRRGPVTPRFLMWAQAVKRNNLQFGDMLVESAKRVRDAFRTAKVGKASTMQDVMPLAEGVDSFIGELVITGVRNGGQRTLKESDERFYASVMANPYLRHFYLGLLHYLIAVSKAWEDQRLHLDPLPKRDDWTDLALLLYVRDARDLIITADAQVRTRVLAVVPHARIGSAAQV